MVLLALVSWCAFVVAKRWGVLCGTSGSSQRDRPGLRGAWRAGCAADVRIVRAYRGCASGMLVELACGGRAWCCGVSPLRCGICVWLIHERRNSHRDKGINNSTGQSLAQSLPSPA